MPLSLSVKNVPEELADRLREQAKRHHRSMQGEVLAILEEAVMPRRPSVREAFEAIKELGFSSEDESTAIIREDRDSR